MTKPLTINDIMSEKFIEDVMVNNVFNKFIDIKLRDGIVRMDTRIAILHGILWKPYKAFNLHISSEDIYLDHKGVVEFGNRKIAQILTIQYQKLIDKFKNKTDHHQILLILNNVIDDLWNFSKRYLGEYIQTISASRIYNLMQIPELQKYSDIKLSNKEGTKISEARLNQSTKELIQTLSSRNLSYNPLINFMETGSLKSNQIPQMMIAYGPRSDIDDSMMTHIISRSSLQGLHSVADFGVEYLAAKKSMWFSKKVIQKTQYSARKHKLLCSIMQKIYPGDCGSKFTIPILLKKEHKNAFLYKDIMDGRRRITLTRDVINKYVDKIINIKSPLLCRYTDGFCESCAGRNGGSTIETFPRGFNPGLAASSEIGGKVSQLILSAKHLISTNTITYKLPTSAEKYFIQSSEGIYFNKASEKNIKNMYIAIPLKNIGPLTDLTLYNLPLTTTYTNVEQLIVLTMKRKELMPDMFNMANEGKYFPHFSEDMLLYMKSIYPRLKVENKTVLIPMDKWDCDKSIFDFMFVNDDMVAYANKISKFTSSLISNYTSLAEVLEAYTNVLYLKAQTNIFFVEIILRSLMITEPKVNYNIPVVDDIDDVHFGTLSEVVDNRSVCTKFGFEEINRYLQNPDTYMIDRPPGIHDFLFGSM